MACRHRNLCVFPIRSLQNGELVSMSNFLPQKCEALSSSLQHACYTFNHVGNLSAEEVERGGSLRFTDKLV